MNSHFQIKYQILFFYQFLYFWNVFVDISKQQNAQTCKTVTNVTQKQKKKYLTRKFGTDFKYTYGYKTMKPILMSIFKFEYTIYPSMVNMQHFVFELRLLQFSANRRPCIVTMATRSK